MGANLLITLPGCLLCVLLALAVACDVRTRRIPNLLVFPGALAGLLLNGLLPAGDGLFSAPFGGLGLLAGLAGLAVGLAFLMPMYLLRAMGAGDVKLLAMLGAFLGPRAVFGAAILCLLAGGVLALAVACWSGTLRQILSNTYHMMLHSLLRGIGGDTPSIEAPATPSGKLPYAIAIAAGALPYIVLARSHGGGLLP